MEHLWWRLKWGINTSRNLSLYVSIFLKHQKKTYFCNFFTGKILILIKVNCNEFLKCFPSELVVIQVRRNEKNSEGTTIQEILPGTMVNGRRNFSFQIV